MHLNKDDQTTLPESLQTATPVQATSAAESSQAESPAQEALSSRNWELELLISGAVFFSLFQLPGLIQRSVEDAILQTSGNVITMFLLYAKALSYLLIFNLGGHFLLRGYWVGLLVPNDISSSYVIPIRRRFYHVYMDK